jgi:hypothetical protein
MININNFIRVWTNRQANYDAEKKYNGQCTQIVKFWALVNNWSIPNGGGHDAFGYKDFRSGYIWVENTIKAIPKPGDILVFDELVNHVSIVVKADLRNVTSFDQNWPRLSKCNLVTHILYRHVIGWLHWNR